MFHPVEVVVTGWDQSVEELEPQPLSLEAGIDQPEPDEVVWVDDRWVGVAVSGRGATSGEAEPEEDFDVEASSWMSLHWGFQKVLVGRAAGFESAFGARSAGGVSLMTTLGSLPS